MDDTAIWIAIITDRRRYWRLVFLRTVGLECAIGTMHRWHDIGHTLTSDATTTSVSNNRHYIRSRSHANWMDRLVLISMAISRRIIQTNELMCPLWSLQSRLFLLQFLLSQLQRSQTIFFYSLPLRLRQSRVVRYRFRIRT